MLDYDLESRLADLLTSPEARKELELQRATTFERAGIMGNERGLVLKMADGSEFQITIVQSR